SLLRSRIVRSDASSTGIVFTADSIFSASPREIAAAPAIWEYTPLLTAPAARCPTCRGVHAAPRLRRASTRRAGAAEDAPSPAPGLRAPAPRSQTSRRHES